MPSYLEDTSDILRMFENEDQQGPLSEGSFPVSIDVVSLYTNIPLEGENGGPRAFEKALNKRVNPQYQCGF